jgi:hypothetical protein
MDIRQLIGLGFQLLTKVRLPSGEPPSEPDLVQLYQDSLAQVNAQISPVISISASDTPDSQSLQALPPATTAPLLPPSEPSSESNVSVACIPCVRAHVSAAAGFLTEALRMGRGDGLTHPEVANRINLAQGEIVSAERIDLTPEAILRAPREEKAVIEWLLPRIRELRQHIITIDSLEDLLEVSVEANTLGRDLTLRHLEAKGVDVGKLEDIAQQVSDKKITIEQAKQRVKELVPG